jgi:hypothetical protein
VYNEKVLRLSAGLSFLSPEIPIFPNILVKKEKNQKREN